MKRLLCLLILSTLISSATGQKKVSIDFDGDGKLDYARLLGDDEGMMRIEYALSSKGSKSMKSGLFMEGGFGSELSVDRNILQLGMQSVGSNSLYKFRYSPKVGQVILIGYDYSYQGEEGATSKSYNLLTGQFVGSYTERTGNRKPVTRKVNKTFPIKVYPLNTFSDDIIYEVAAIE
jgi:hypothetical protein